MSETVCIRRWYTTWTACTCSKCGRLRNRARKHARLGIAQRTPSADAWAVIDRMIANDWTAAAIASACKISQRSAVSILHEVAQGHRRKFGATLAHLIVNHSEPTRGHVGATGARRRTRALAVACYSQADIASAAGMNVWTTIAAIQRGETQRISPRVAAAIDSAYRQLSRQPGMRKKAGEAAVRQGWHGVGAWDDIDDPNEVPVAGDDNSRGRTPTRKIADLREQGKDAREIAVLLNMPAERVERAIERMESEAA